MRISLILFFCFLLGWCTYALIQITPKLLAPTPTPIQTTPKPLAPTPTPIQPILVLLEGPRFRETIKVTTDEEIRAMGNWYLSPRKAPVENYILVRTIEGKEIRVARSQVISMTGSAE